MKEFYTEIFINASTNKVWEAFIHPGQFFKAFFNADIQSTFKIGERIEYAGFTEDIKTVHIYGKILEFQQGKLLSYTDHPGPIYNANHQDMISRVYLTFDSHGATSKLTVTNDQFSENNPMEQEAKQWYLILSNLKTWIETGQLMNLPNQ